MIHASTIALTRVDLRVEWRFDLRVNEEMANPSGVDPSVNEGNLPTPSYSRIYEG